MNCNGKKPGIAITDAQTVNAPWNQEKLLWIWVKSCDEICAWS